MNQAHLSSMNEYELFKLHSQIMEELLTRNVIRTANNPIADYAEWLVAAKLNLKLLNSSNSGFDAIDVDNKRIQIKCRKLKKTNGSRQLGVIRNIDNNPFDSLIAIIFNENYEVIEAYKIPLAIIKNHSKYSSHQNGHILHLKGSVLLDSQAENLTSNFI